MANWILAEWLRQVFDRDPDYTFCRDRISAGGFDRPDMQEVSPCQDSFCMKSTILCSMHIQAFFALTMDELKQLGVEPMAIRKKLFMAIQSECECTEICCEETLHGHEYQYPSICGDG